MHFGHLHDEEVEQLDAKHEEEFPDAADLQEDGAGQQAQQHAGSKVLKWETYRGGVYFRFHDDAL